jgi:hypothetical protein
MEPDMASLVEYVISDMLLPFAKTKLSAMSRKTRRSLDQELQGIARPRRGTVLSAKSQLKPVLGARTSSLRGRDLAEILGIHHAVELKILTEQTYPKAEIPCDSRRNLKDSRKTEVLDWIQEPWDSLSTTIAMNCLTRRRCPSIQPLQA